MYSGVTRVGNLRVEDITFKGARSQSEVAKELLKEQGITNIDRPTPVPKSLTPEQLIKFYEECATREPDRATLYVHTTKVIKEYDKLNKENKTLKARIARLEDEVVRLKDGDDGESTSTDEVDNSLE